MATRSEGGVEMRALLDALVVAQDRVAALGDLLHVPADTLDEAEVVRRLLAEALAVTASDVAVLDADGDGRPVTTVTRGAVPSELAARAALAVTDRTASTAQARGDVVVVRLAEGARGPALALARVDAASYGTGELDLARTLLAAALKLVRLARLHRESLERATVDREHRLASELTQAALPPVPAELPGLDVATRCRPAAVAGGDLVVVARHGRTSWFAVGDVAGKGLPAATVMTRVVSALQVAFRSHAADDPAGVLGAVAAATGDHLDAVGLFLTLVVGAIEEGAGTAHLANAAHWPVMVRSPDRPAWRTVRASCPPVGVAGDGPRTERVPFGPGALLVVGTDGLTDQLDPDGRPFGPAALLAACDGPPGQDAATTADRVVAAVEAHAGGRAPTDDRTLLVVRARPNSASGPGLGPRIGSVLDLPADLLALRALGPWLTGVLEAVGTTTTAARLELGLHEICVNVVEHAYGGGPGRLQVAAHATAENLVLVVTDQGAPFDASEVTRPVPGVAQIRGYGLTIADRVFDAVDHHRTGGTTTWLLRSAR